MKIFAEELRRDPYRTYEELHRGGSNVVHMDDLGFSMVLDYEGVKRGLVDTDAFSSDLTTSRGNVFEWMVFMDPPRHTQVRAIVGRAFTPRSIAALEGKVRELSATLADQLVAAGSGEVDLVAGFSMPLPMLVITHMMGLPHEDWQRLGAWAEAILRLVDKILQEGALTAVQAFDAVQAEIGAYLDAHIAERQRRPTDDLLTRLVQAEVDGARLTRRELLHFFELLIVAGTETTMNLISNTIICLTEHPAELARLRADPALVPTAVEETLRYRSPVQAIFRIARRTMELGGREIPAGRFVLLMIGAANRDRSQFSDPDRYDVGRSPNPHLAFGQGIHFCIGAPLSRLEGQIAIPDLLKRMATFELVSPSWPPHAAFHIHGPLSLPIRFTT
ncbi:MAG TPA: cytochrome P450 [Kofleriaceae bacterium]|nr:cytochrome P450 [Kofleriaceae bacterium]